MTSKAALQLLIPNNDLAIIFASSISFKLQSALAGFRRLVWPREVREKKEVQILPIKEGP